MNHKKGDDYIWKNKSDFPVSCSQCGRVQDDSGDMGFWRALDKTILCSNCNSEILRQQIFELQEENVKIHRDASTLIAKTSDESIKTQQVLNDKIVELLKIIEKEKK